MFSVHVWIDATRSYTQQSAFFVCSFFSCSLNTSLSQVTSIGLCGMVDRWWLHAVYVCVHCAPTVPYTYTRRTSIHSFYLLCESECAPVIYQTHICYFNLRNYYFRSTLIKYYVNKCGVRARCCSSPTSTPSLLSSSLFTNRFLIDCLLVCVAWSCVVAIVSQSWTTRGFRYRKSWKRWSETFQVCVHCA